MYDDRSANVNANYNNYENCNDDNSTLITTLLSNDSINVNLN